MAGLEVVVRPLIFPDIRPRPRPALPPQDDPTKGFAVIQGNPAMGTSSSLSQSISSSHSNPVEAERRVDQMRIYQQEDDGTVNRDNFVDVQVATRIKMKRPVPTGPGFYGQTSSAGGGVAADGYYEKFFYERPKEEENIEVQSKDVIIPSQGRP